MDALREIESGSTASQGGTPSASRASGVSSSSKVYFSHHNTSESPEYHDAYTMSTTSSTGHGGGTKDGAARARAVRGWYLYDVGAGAYAHAVAPLLFPLLVYGLVAKAALGVDGWELRCVPGEGYAFVSPDG